MQLAPNDAYTSNVAPPAFPKRATVLVPLWLSAALVVVGSGAFARAPAPVLPLTVVMLTILALWSALSDEEGRRWSDSASPARLALFHAWRLVPGIVFLYLYAHGWLPRGFAVPGGIGDIAVALTAPLAAWAAGRREPAARASYLAWNVFGFLDLVNVVRAGAVLTLADPAPMHLLRVLPLGLLPTFAVPLTFAAHVLAFRRYMQKKLEQPLKQP
jgi:hypothetical protein